MRVARLLLITVAILCILYGFGFQLYLIWDDIRALRMADSRLTDLLTKMKEFKNGIGCEIKTGLYVDPRLPEAARNYQKANFDYAKAIQTDFNQMRRTFRSYFELGELDGYKAGLFKNEHDQLIARIKANLASGQKELEDSCH